MSLVSLEQFRQVMLSIVDYLGELPAVALFAKWLNVGYIACATFANGDNMIGSQWFSFATTQATVVIFIAQVAPFLRGICAAVSIFLRYVFVVIGAMVLFGSCVFVAAILSNSFSIFGFPYSYLIGNLFLMGIVVSFLSFLDYFRMIGSLLPTPFITILSFSVNVFLTISFLSALSTRFAFVEMSIQRFRTFPKLRYIFDLVTFITFFKHLADPNRQPPFCGLSSFVQDDRRITKQRLSTDKQKRLNRPEQIQYKSIWVECQ